MLSKILKGDGILEENAIQKETLQECFNLLNFQRNSVLGNCCWSLSGGTSLSRKSRDCARAHETLAPSPARSLFSAHRGDISHSEVNLRHSSSNVITVLFMQPL